MYTAVATRSTAVHVATCIDSTAVHVVVLPVLLLVELCHCENRHSVENTPTDDTITAFAQAFFIYLHVPVLLYVSYSTYWYYYAVLVASSLAKLGVDTKARNVM